MRILHDLEVAGKKLVAKVDPKNKLLCDNFREEEVQASEDDEKREDETALASIAKIITEHQEEIDNFETIQSGKGKWNIEIRESLSRDMVVIIGVLCAIGLFFYRTTAS